MAGEGQVEAGEKAGEAVVVEEEEEEEEEEEDGVTEVVVEATEEWGQYPSQVLA